MDIRYADLGITPIMYRIAHNCIKVQNEWIKEFSISTPQAVILGLITFFSDYDINQKTLSEKMGVKESSISSIIKTMIKNGLIYKEQSKTDGRNYILKATDKGAEISVKVEASAKKFEDYFYAKLTTDEKTQLKNILLKLI